MPGCLGDVQCSQYKHISVLGIPQEIYFATVILDLELLKCLSLHWNTCFYNGTLLSFLFLLVFVFDITKDGCSVLS
jgi:hypothetical protein